MITLDALAKDHALRLNSEEVWLYLVTVSFPAPSAKSFYLVNNTEAITSNGQKFEPCEINIVLSVDDNNHSSVANITIDNVDRLLISNLRTNASPPGIDIKVVLASRPNVVQAHFAGLSMKEVSWNLSALQGALYDQDLLSMRYPADLISYESGYNSLFRQ